MNGSTVRDQHMSKSSHDPKEIFDDWTHDPRRPIFLVDETRKPVFDTGDEITLFTCVALSARSAQTVMKAIAQTRTTNESFKGRDFSRPEVQASSGALIDIWCRSLQLVQDIKIAATTAMGQGKLAKDSKAKLHTETDEESSERPRTIEGRELSTVIHLLLKMAIDLKIESRQIDAILDRSDAMGLAPQKRALTKGLMEVMGPGRLDVRPSGTQASLKCSALFRLISDSDDGPFRDLLVLPDFYGYELSHRIDYTELYKKLRDDPVRLLPFDIAVAKRAQLFYTNKTKQNPGTH